MTDGAFEPLPILKTAPYKATGAFCPRLPSATRAVPHVGSFASDS